MRNQLNKLVRGKSTKAERVFLEALKSFRIPFKAKVRLEGLEVDFLIGKIVVEINGHDQSPERNNKLVSLGYVPIHYTNQEILNNRDKIIDKIICHLHDLN